MTRSSLASADATVTVPHRVAHSTLWWVLRLCAETMCCDCDL